MRRATVLSALVVGLLAIPVAAFAHPSFNPSSLPPGEAVLTTLVVPHGCAPGGGMPGMGDDADGEAVPTTELALQQTEGVTIEPGEVEGWDVTDDGEAWVWTDAGGATTDVIELPVALTLAEGALESGEDLYLRAFQECEDGSSFAWVGTPDEEAQYPAVLLEASDGEVGQAEADEETESGVDHGEMDMGDDGEMAMEDDEMAMEDDEMAGDDSQMEEMAGDDSEMEEMAGDMGDDDMAADESAAEDDAFPAAIVAAIGIALVGGIALVMFRRRA